ncbi:alpha/beta hydrolase [Cellulomonas sp. PhB143]|uniref:alpha/beta hydrolase n=1 Tax=Cellulomonas sp. PhB143 TaxID=2485186 RepID=UPI000F9262A0|nr:alpha/beta hydrolase [Cellulomonas sp. PhB143]ROS75497.1 acetyl esterase/lipase [Cellulomonas sp. PhB143]
MTLPWGYLVTVGLVGWCTFFAVVAPRRPHPVAMMSWWFGLVVNEVPFLAIVLLVASTVLAAAEGDLDPVGARVAAAVAAVVVLGLAVAAWRGVRSDRAVGRALAQGLGPGWRDQVRVPLRRHRPWVRILLLPFVQWQHDVERIRNLRYGDGGRQNLLDVYRRRDAPQGAPVLVHLHGGGFTTGKKSREARPLLNHLASRGWVCVSANYRLRPQTTFPGHQIDAKKVIAWVRERGAAYGADPSRLFVAGSSAGANIAGVCALTPNDPMFQPGFESADTTVTGAVLLYGYYGHYFGEEPDGAPPLLEPQGYVHAGAPPFFVAHGTADGWGTVEGARHFATRLRAAGGTVVYAELPGGQHSFDVYHSPRFEAVVDGVEAFAAHVMARPAPAAPGVAGPRVRTPPASSGRAG